MMGLGPLVETKRLEIQIEQLEAKLAKAESERDALIAVRTGCEAAVTELVMQRDETREFLRRMTGQAQAECQRAERAESALQDLKLATLAALTEAGIAMLEENPVTPSEVKSAIGRLAAERDEAQKARDSWVTAALKAQKERGDQWERAEKAEARVRVEIENNLAHEKEINEQWHNRLIAEAALKLDERKRAEKAEAEFVQASEACRDADAERDSERARAEEAEAALARYPTSAADAIICKQQMIEQRARADRYLAAMREWVEARHAVEKVVEEGSKIPAEGSDYVRCPRCKSRHRDLYEYELEDGQTGEIECGCGHTFKITCRVSITYTVEEEAYRD